MVVRIQLSYGPSGRPVRWKGSPRRVFIYPHRSVRFLRIATPRILLAVLTAGAILAFLVINNAELLAAHQRICQVLLEFMGIPLTGVLNVDLFPGLAQAPVADAPVMMLEQAPGRFAILFGAAVTILTVVFQRVLLARGFVVFLGTLLAVTAVVTAVRPSIQFGTVEFSQIWLRGEMLVWLLLPCFSAFAFMLIHPVGILPVAWTMLLEGFSFCWSAVRLAFCLAVLHFTGILFIPLLWFALGILADMVYLMVFYSVVVYWSARKSWGVRAQ